MFDSLADRIKQDENVGVNTTQRLLRWALMLTVSVVLFAALYFAVRGLS